MSQPRPTARLRALDGLRGVAAFIVLIHHAVLAVPALAVPYFGPYDATTPGSPAWWLTYSPLHLVWAGGEAVVVFFVLSGLVLALKADRPRFDWSGYFPERMARLYVPVAAGVAFGVAVAVAFPRTAAPELGPWMSLRPTTPTPSGVAHDLLLVFGPSRLITPLWSLQWEVIFSILLPLYLVAAMALRRCPLVLVALSIGASAMGDAVALPWLTYLPMFAVGVALAPLVASPTRPSPRARWAWAALGVASLLLLSSQWTLAPLLHQSVVAVPVAGMLVILGAAGIVVAAVRARALRWLLELRIAQWLGRISFSLYLIHEPIVLTLGEALGPGRGPWVLPLAVLVSLPVAALFFRIVERPSHRLAKRVGAWASGLSLPRVAPGGLHGPRTHRTDQADIPAVPSAPAAAVE